MYRPQKPHRPPSGDLFDLWLDLLVDLVIQPLLDVLNLAWRAIRNHVQRKHRR